MVYHATPYAMLKQLSDKYDAIQQGLKHTGIWIAKLLIMITTFFSYKVGCWFIVGDDLTGASDVVLETRVLVSRTKMKVLVLVLDHEVLVLVSNIWFWSWSRSWRKSLAVFETFVVILDGSEQGTPYGILWETTKAVCHSEAIVWENLLRSMHISLRWEGI